MFWSLHFPSMGHMLELRQLQLLSLVSLVGLEVVIVTAFIEGFLVHGFGVVKALSV